LWKKRECFIIFPSLEKVRFPGGEGGTVKGKGLAQIVTSAGQGEILTEKKKEENRETL